MTLALFQLPIVNLLLAVAVILILVGIPIAFSKKERQRVQARVMTELPERSPYLGPEDALKAYQRRGFIMLAVGVALLAVWAIVTRLWL
jgi:hypothetical protein